LVLCCLDQSLELWQIARIDIRDPALCLRLFKSNRDAGLILFAALWLDVVVKRLI
jgi:4-hydroxybenzoate polyprenyltransferase